MTRPDGSNLHTFGRDMQMIGMADTGLTLVGEKKNELEMLSRITLLESMV